MRGAFAPLHWLAAARAEFVPVATRDRSVLLDLACGGGLLAPRVATKGHCHVGIDITPACTALAHAHGVATVRGDVLALPFATASADVVVAGEILEHVRDVDAVVGEIGRVLRPGGTLVLDALADTRRCRVVFVTIGERIGVVPSGVHDPDLFVDPDELVRSCSAHGIALSVWGLRPPVGQVLGWLGRRRDDVELRPVRSTGMVVQGVGVRR